MANKDKLDILLVCSPDMGHLIPVMNLADGLCSAGHTVKLITCGYLEVRVGDNLKRMGCQFIPVNVPSQEDWEKVLHGDEVPFLKLREMWKQPVLELVRELQPQLDVVVSDFAAMAGMDAAEALGLPHVINIPGPIALLASFLGLPDLDTTCSCGGWTLGFSKFTGIKFAAYMNVMGIATWTRTFKHHAGRSNIILQSFFGLEPPTPLPPNLRLTGPILPPAKELGQRFVKNHPEIYAWLHRDGAPTTIFITTGSMIPLHDWQVREVFGAVKKAGLRAVWSLKEKQQAALPSKDDPDFWIGSWLPQAELLQDDLIKCVITHCGWGGTLECLNAGQPVVCLPFFGDQPTNADILVKAGCGEHIGKLPKQVFSVMNVWTEGSFTAEIVAPILQKVSQDPKYKKAARRMQRAALATGGIQAAVQEIEWTARFGNEHCLSKDVVKTWGGNPFQSVVSVAVAGAAAGVVGCFHLPGLAAVAAMGCAAGIRAMVRQQRRMAPPPAPKIVRGLSRGMESFSPSMTDH